MKSNNTYLNILVSYAYTGASKDFNDLAIKQSVDGVANVMIDSGAFTIFNSKKKTKLNLDNYCLYLDKVADKVEKYVMLDVIKNEEQTKKNYETMLKRGFNPMFVFTEYDTDWDYMIDAVKNQKHLCVAGGVTNRGEWILKRYQDVYQKTKAKIHALGFVQFNDIFRLPLHSVDSSSWIMSQRYGALSYFDNKINTVRYIDILTRKVKMPLVLKQELENIKVNPKEFSDLDNHKGGKSIGNFLNILAFSKYQKYSKAMNLKLFLAVGNKKQLSDILYVNENLENLDYNKWKRKTL